MPSHSSQSATDGLSSPVVDVSPVPSQDAGPVVNIARRLRQYAESIPSQTAIAQHVSRNPDGSYRYVDWTFFELDQLTDKLASGLMDFGVRAGTRLVLFVPFSREFIALTFAILKTGAVVVLIDPGMGKQNVFRCLEEVDPHGFIAVPKVHAVRVLKRKLFPKATLNVTVGRRWLWGGRTYQQLEKTSKPFSGMTTKATDPAAVIFTSGSTGAPKGVCYEHGMFEAQVDLIRDHYGIQPGEIDLPGFPLFGLFNAAMGVTTVIPDMDPTRPADVVPDNILQHIRDRQVTQAFGSPAFWNRIGRFCDQHGVTLPTIQRGLSAGGPVPIPVIERMQRALTSEGAELFTPYGATESLPVASIGSREVLTSTAERTRQGAGTCVGRPFNGVDVRIIPLCDGLVGQIGEVNPLPPHEIGEIIVRSPAVTREYFQRPQETGLSKIADPPGSRTWWHRIGDVGYFDDEGRLWFCGRKAHIVETSQGMMFPVRCESIINEHPDVYRSALVGVGNRPEQSPVIIVEPEEDSFPETATAEQRLQREILERAAENEMTGPIAAVLFHRSLPVDPRHNVKINRELLAGWAAGQLSRS